MNGSDSSGPYVIVHGDLWYEESGLRQDGPLGPQRRHVCDGTGEIGVAYDAGSGTLHKHGESARVQRWASATRRKFSGAGYEDMARDIVVISFPVTPETVAELNACVATTGRVATLQARLTRLLETRPELLTLPRYPSN